MMRATTPRIITQDATIENLADRSRGLTLFCDELSRFCKSMNRYNAGGADRPFDLECHSGGSFAIDRIGRPVGRGPRSQTSSVVFRLAEADWHKLLHSDEAVIRGTGSLMFASPRRRNRPSRLGYRIITTAGVHSRHRCDPLGGESAVAVEEKALMSSRQSLFCDHNDTGEPEPQPTDAGDSAENFTRPRARRCRRPRQVPEQGRAPAT
jgi:hypothetical protein